LLADAYYVRGIGSSNSLEQRAASLEKAQGFNPFIDAYRSSQGLLFDEAFDEYTTLRGVEEPADRQAAERLLARAEAEYLEVMQFSPHEADTYEFLSHLYNRAGVRLDPGCFTKAEEVALEGLEYAPNNPDINLEAGVALLYTGRLAQARERLELANRLDPADVEAAALLGDAYYGLGEMENARAAYRRVVALNPEYGTVAQALAELDRELAAGDSSTTSGSPSGSGSSDDES
jgi:tetratricopeptide (TPR) repeat protein